jgi:NADH-quinone oxidoreductase subunit N
LSSPIIWIIYPVAFSIFLWILRKYTVFVKISAVVFCGSLLLTGLLLPINTFINLGSFSFEISDELFILGRRLVLGNNDQQAILFFFGLATFWFAGTLAIEINEHFVPISLSIVALFISAIAVEPFLYASLLIEICVLMIIPVILWDRKSVEQGVILFLVFQTLAMPLILLAGWSSSGFEANPTDQTLLQQTVILFGLGFAILLAIFPFHSWLPVFVRQNHPYITGFILTLQPILVLFLALDFLNAFVWLRNYPQLFEGIRLIGLMIILISGFLAAFTQDMGRMFAYAVMLENGFAVLALSFGNLIGLNILVLSFIPRVIGLSVWALSLSVLKYMPETGFTPLIGSIRNHPVASLALILAGLSISGLPILPTFPIRLMVFENIIRLSLNNAIMIFIGTVGFLVGILRMIRLLVVSTENQWHIGENWVQILFLIGGIGMMLIFGLYPKLSYPILLPILSAFEYLP